MKKPAYTRIPTSKDIAAFKESIQYHDWETTISILEGNGLYLPTPATFIPYLVALHQADQSKQKFLDEEGRPLPKGALHDLVQRLSSDALIWIDAKFVKGSGHLGLDIETNHRVRYIKEQNNVSTYRSFITSPLETCLTHTCYVDLDTRSFNAQGLPIKESKTQRYISGKTIRYNPPRLGCVAKLNANSIRASFSCNWDPKGLGSALEIFARVEDASQKVTRRTK